MKKALLGGLLSAVALAQVEVRDPIVDVSVDGAPEAAVDGPGDVEGEVGEVAVPGEDSAPAEVPAADEEEAPAEEVPVEEGEEDEEDEKVPAGDGECCEPQQYKCCTTDADCCTTWGQLECSVGVCVFPGAASAGSSSAGAGGEEEEEPATLPTLPGDGSHTEERDGAPLPRPSREHHTGYPKDDHGRHHGRHHHDSDDDDSDSDDDEDSDWDEDDRYDEMEDACEDDLERLCPEAMEREHLLGVATCARQHAERLRPRCAAVLASQFPALLACAPELSEMCPMVGEHVECGGWSVSPWSHERSREERRRDQGVRCIDEHMGALSDACTAAISVEWSGMAERLGLPAKATPMSSDVYAMLSWPPSHHRLWAMYAHGFIAALLMACVAACACRVCKKRGGCGARCSRQPQAGVRVAMAEGADAPLAPEGIELAAVQVNYTGDSAAHLPIATPVSTPRSELRSVPYATPAAMPTAYAPTAYAPVNWHS